MVEFTLLDLTRLLLLAARWTLLLSVIAFIGGGIVGLLLLVLRYSHHRLATRFVQLYTELFQSTPLLMQFYLVFFGFWLLLIGYLVYRSRFMPQLVGAFVMLSGLTWVLQIWPPLVNAVSPWNLILDGPGEISLMLWLLVFGVNADRWRQRAGITTSS